MAALAIALAAGGSSAAPSRLQAVPSNTAPPAIEGTADQGSVVAASTGAWTNAPTSFGYQWLRCDPGCSDIAGATDETYVVGTADPVGSTLEVEVTAKNGSGSSAPSPPSAAETVGAAPSGAPAAQGTPAISGTARQGRTLTASNGSWSSGSIAYRWQRCDATGAGCAAITGAASSTYTAVAADTGHRLRVLVTAANGGASSSAESRATAVVANGAAPSNTSAPTISGSAVQGVTLGANRGNWNGDTPITYSYQWQRCNTAGSSCSNVGTDSANYALAGADVNHTMRVVVTAKNGIGFASVTSAPTAVVSASAKPNNTRAPSISGNVSQDSTLTANAGTWGGTTPISFTYQWRRCDSGGNRCADISKATGRTYKLTADDVGHRLRVVLTGRNVAGAGSATSGASAVVGARVPLNTKQPTIAGDVRQGGRLSVGVGSWSSATKVTYHDQWFRCDTKGQNCNGIVGASLSTYVVTGADVGHTLLVQVRAQNSAGSTIANSKPTGVVGGAAAGGIQVAAVALPDRLQVDRVSFTPRRITTRSRPLVVRVHVREIGNGKSVSGALVRVIAIPYSRLSKTKEVVTDGSGWATLTFTVRRGFPLRRGYLITLFVRARKPGENVLAGVSTRRLVSVRVG